MRRGWGSFGRFRPRLSVANCRIRAWAKLWRRVASEFGFGSWGFGSVLFDNRIGRKRDVGGGVLAGPWLSGRLFKRKLENSIRGLRPEETTDGHVSTIHRASNEARETAVRRTAWFLFGADVLELVKIQCSPEH